ncbi:MAG TPA: ATP-binding protein [Actinomycetota bacterium]|nr:ATP-binding protein [Actinomycetota bacterium]
MQGERDLTAKAAGAETSFQALLDAAPDAMVGVARDGTIVLANGQAETLFGYPAAQLVGSPVELLIPERVKAIHRTHREGYFEEPRTRPMGVGLDLAGLRADGTEFPAEISLSAIETDDGMLALAAIRDITDRKLAEREMHRAREEADRANRAKSDFLSRMSHELRTPLNSVLGFAQLLEMEPLSQTQHESVREIIRGGGHLLDLINEILDITRIETGRISLSPEPVDVGLTLTETLQLIRPIADQANVRIREPTGETEVEVRADRQRLKQVLLNLLSNAVKYNREGGEIRIACERRGTSRFRVSVIDTGIGFDEKQLAQLFAPFERLGAEQRGIDGTGLGLALSKGLIETMDGVIGAESTEGVGSTFWFELPMTTEVVGVDVAEAAATPVRTGESRTVLYIEDNPANFQLVERMLSYRPHVTLLSAMQGSIGLELARRHQPDLIFLDLHLPDMHGEEVLRQARADERTSDIPVVVISADARGEARMALLAGGAQGFLTKPVSVSLFLETVDQLLG